MSLLKDVGDAIDTVTKPVYEATLQPALGPFGQGGQEAANTFDDKVGKPATKALGVD